MQPTRPLMAEHQTILHMMADIVRKLKVFRETERVDTRYVDTAIDFIRTYADGCHHGKEEGILFRELDLKTLDAKPAALMGQLVQEHAWARKTTGRLIEANRAYAAGDTGQLQNVLGPLQHLADFYPGHITKEECRFFDPCMTYFTEDEQEAMLAKFAEFDRKLIHEKYRRMVQEFERDLDA
jgi:hemerythrin-like domain-containing protein